jgi:hypothetical protein
MSTKRLDIEPYDYVKKSVAVSMSLKVLQFVLFTSVIVNATLYDEDGLVVLTTNIEIAGEDYLKWSNDDNYIYDYVSKSLDVVIKPSSSV